jgi:hypothetical protein
VAPSAAVEFLRDDRRFAPLLREERSHQLARTGSGTP